MLKPQQILPALHRVAKQRNELMDRVVTLEIDLAEASEREAALKANLDKEKAKTARLRKRLKTAEG